MVNVVKFSQFDAAVADNPTNTLVGITDPSGGSNIKYPFTPTWTTAGRPTMPYDGLLGYNTDIEEWEFFQNSTSEWRQLATTSSGENWTVETDAAIGTVVNEGYIANRAGTPVVFTLPATFNIGDRVLIMGLGSGGWSLVANAGQTIRFGSYETSTAGAITSDIQYANIEVKGLVDGITWSVWSVNSEPDFT